MDESARLVDRGLIEKCQRLMRELALQHGRRRVNALQAQKPEFKVARERLGRHAGCERVDH